MVESRVSGKVLLLANFIVVLLGSSENSFYWLRQGPDPQGWVEANPLCGGLQQSPIDIRDEFVVSNPRLGEFFFSGYDSAFPGSVTVQNTGQDFKIFGFDERISVVGGGLPANRYRIEQLHFHWGSTSAVGSEHTVNGRFFPLEMHVVHFSQNYADFAEAVNSPQGLAVLGVLFEVSMEPNPAYEPLLRALQDIGQSGAETTIPSFALRSLFPRDMGRFWRYQGSLTTRPCFESVVWTVFKEQVKLSESQFDIIRTSLKTISAGTEVPLVDNFRPVQPLNTRVIEECDPSSITGISISQPVPAAQFPRATKPTQPPPTTQSTPPPQVAQATQAPQMVQTPPPTQKGKSVYRLPAERKVARQNKLTKTFPNLKSNGFVRPRKFNRYPPVPNRLVIPARANSNKFVRSKVYVPIKTGTNTNSGRFYKANR